MKTLLVPIDFTDITENALKHALVFAQTCKAHIVLLHLVEMEDEIASALRKLEVLAGKYAGNGIHITVDTQLGQITEIGRYASGYESNLVYMGTHGLKGLQYLFGSKALSVVSNSKTAFVITQAAPKRSAINEIVVPVDFIAEEKQILHNVIEIARLSGARVHLFSANYTDEFLKKRTELNLKYAKTLLESHKMEVISIFETGNKGYASSLLGYANMVEADLIAIINHKEDGIKNLIGSNFDQQMITNKFSIPVLIMNYKQILKVYDLFSGIAALK